MQTSDKPILVPVPFAATGTKNTIPTDPSGTPGEASLELGFPPVTMIPIVAGGIPPLGADVNGILNLITQTVRWVNAGGTLGYDSAFSTAIGGYPKGAVLLNSAGDGFWLGTVDNNTSNPDSGGAGWVPAFNHGIAAITGLTNANVTLSAAQLAKPIITLAGTLTGNIQIIFPVQAQQWLVVNGTSGAFTVTCKTAAGSGIAVAQGGAAELYGDGTNILLPAEQVGAATAATHAVQLVQVQQNYAWNHGFAAITATGNFPVPANVYFLDVELWGGGAGGGGVGSTGNFGGGGGGGGGYSRWVGAVTPGQVISCTIGAAGVGGSPGGAGGGGGTTTFGAFASATGGVGGSPNSSGNGGAGGSGTLGTYVAGGGPGGAAGNGLGSVGGAGGTASFGGAGGNSGNGVSAGGQVPGGGGGGCGPNSASSGAAGGAGRILISY